MLIRSRICRLVEINTVPDIALFDIDYRNLTGVCRGGAVVSSRNRFIVSQHGRLAIDLHVRLVHLKINDLPMLYQFIDDDLNSVALRASPLKNRFRYRNVPPSEFCHKLVRWNAALLRRGAFFRSLITRHHLCNDRSGKSSHSHHCA